MLERVGRPWMISIAAYVAMPALVVGLLTSLVTAKASRTDVRVAGTVSLSVLAGNEFDFNLNAWSADLDAALASGVVQRAVRAAATDTGEVRGLRAERIGHASQVSLSLSADSEQTGADALLAAGRTALLLVARDQEAQLIAAERFAQQSLQARLTAGERLTAGPPDAALEGLPATLSREESVRDARERSINQALAELAQVQQELAVVRQVIGSDPLPGVNVDDVYAASLNPQVLRTGMSAGLAIGLLGGLLLYARRTRSQPTEGGPVHPVAAPASA